MCNGRKIINLKVTCRSEMHGNMSQVIYCIVDIISLLSSYQCDKAKEFDRNRSKLLFSTFL